jgi:hypothetical protein
LRSRVSLDLLHSLSIVMPGLVPGIHVFLVEDKTWMAGTSPAMTTLLGIIQYAE